MSGGRVTRVKIEEARESPKIVMGTLRINSVPASVLFDSGAYMLLCPNNLLSCMG